MTDIVTGGWQPIASAPRDGTPRLLLFGESVPHVPDIRVGTYEDGNGCEKLGYREYAKYGGWLIWNDGSDFYIVDVAEPTHWMPPHPSPTTSEVAG